MHVCGDETAETKRNRAHFVGAKSDRVLYIKLYRCRLDTHEDETSKTQERPGLCIP